MEYLKNLSTNNCYLNQNNPVYVVVHETGNYSKGAGAVRHGQAQSNGSLKGTSVHWYVDDTVAVQTLDYKHGAWAVGDGNGKYGITNKNSINIEICVNPDSNYEKARLNGVELVKKIMKETGIPASKVVRHYDASRKSCPEKMIKTPSLWTDFMNRVKGDSTTTSGSDSTASTGSTSKDLYKVRKSWADAASQKGAFEVLANAKACADKNPGYSVFDANGKSVYTSKVSSSGTGPSGSTSTSTSTKKKDLITRLQRELNTQYKAGLVVDGIWGAKTLAAVVTVKKGAKGNITKVLQEALILHGYSVGSSGVDGDFGANTEAAVKKFQAAKKLSADGIAGQKTFAALLG